MWYHVFNSLRQIPHNKEKQYMISVSHLTKEYGEKKAVDNISFEQAKALRLKC